MKIKALLQLILCCIIISCNGASNRPANIDYNNKSEYKFHEGPIQGTYFHITYEWNEDLSNKIDSLLDTFNSYLSNFDSNSIISKINNNSDYEINDLVKKMIETSTEIYNNTNGAFDITVSPLVNIWNFGWEKNATDENKIPKKETIDSLLQYVGMNKIKIDGTKVIKSNKNITIISSAIAKGLSADYISDYFLNLGLKNYLIEIGGEIFCKGVNSRGGPWVIGIDKPVEDHGYNDRENQLIIKITNIGLATSGNYRKFFKKDGKRYGHTIDPRTGYPAENSMLSATVISNNAMTSDGYATAFMVMGIEDALKLAEKLENVEAYFIYMDENNNEKTIHTSGFDKFILK